MKRLAHLCSFLAGLSPLLMHLAWQKISYKPMFLVAIEGPQQIYAGFPQYAMVIARGIPHDKIQVKAEGMEARHIKGDQYQLYSQYPGKGQIRIIGEGMDTLVHIIEALRIPDPIPVLGGKRHDGMYDESNLTSFGGISVLHEDFNYDCISCIVTGYTVTRTGPKREPVRIYNAGARFSNELTNLLKTARQGDTWYFDNIKCQCPGDRIPRHLKGSLIYKTK